MGADSVKNDAIVRKAHSLNSLSMASAEQQSRDSLQFDDPVGLSGFVQRWRGDIVNGNAG